MLQLQLKDLVALRLPKKTVFFIKLSFLCTGVHAFLLLVLFLLQRNETLFLDTRHTSNASILFVPLLKTANQTGQQSLQTKNLVEKNSTEKKSIIVPAKKTVPQKKEPVKNTVLKKTNPPPKITPKKSIPEKKVSLPKKVPPKPVPPVQKKEQKKVEVKNPEPLKQFPQASSAIQEEQSKQDAVIVGRDDMELLTISTVLKQEILKIWKRPTNVPIHAACHARVLLQKDGTRLVTIEQSSHAIALDISVRNFLLQYNFPDTMIGKELSIIF